MSAAGRVSRRGFTMIELLAVTLIIALLVSILLPAVQQAREAARAAQCRNNLRQITLALHGYHDAAGCFPPGTTGTVSPVRLDPSEHHFAWTVRILPYIGEVSTYERFDFSRTIYQNAADWMTDFEQPDVFYCNSEWALENWQPSYVGFHDDRYGPVTDDGDGLLFLNSSVRRGEIPDGMVSTLILGDTHIPYPVNWACGTLATLRSPENQTPIGNPAITFGSRLDFSFDLVDATNIGPDGEGVSFSHPPDFPSYEAGLQTHSIGAVHPATLHVAAASGEVRAMSRSVEAPLLRSLVHRSDAAPLEGF